jgi:hypothetical protein
MSELSRELYVQCCNPLCGHTWRAVLSIVATITPSNCPNPRVFIARSERKLSEETPSTDSRQIGLPHIPTQQP